MAKRLTARTIEQIPPDPTKRLEIPDAGKPGLYLIVAPTGRKSWAVRYRRRSDGKPRKLTLDGFPSLAVAHKLAQAALDRAAEGHDPAAEKAVQKAAVKAKAGDDPDTFGQVARLFIDRYHKPKNRSWIEVARLLGLRPKPDDVKVLETIKSGLADRWGKRHVGEITRRDIIAELDAIVDRGGGMTANRTLAALRKLWNWSISRDIVQANPCAGVTAPVAEVQRDRVLTDDEVRLFWKACERIGEPFGAPFKLLLLTGQRRSEVGEMTWSEIDADAKLWRIPSERAKNGEPHDVPLSDAALAVLEGVKRIHGKAGLLFTTTGETAISGWSRAKDQLDRAMLKIAHETAAERGDDPSEVEVAPWRTHDLRRTAASGMARLGINLPVIEKVLNHRSGSFAGIVGVYQRHSFADEKREALHAWGRFVLSLTDAAPTNVLNMRKRRRA